MRKKTSSPLRQLARSAKYQNLFSLAKEIPGIQLFENVKDFSKIQLDFLFWLTTYNRLYQELAIGDNHYLTKEIIENDVWCECYLIWERKRKAEIMEQEKPGKGGNRRNKKRQATTNDTRVPSIVFTKGKKK